VVVNKVFRELYKYREFLKTSVLKEFRGKYKKSFLGVLWSFINPLLQLVIYSVVFSFIMKSGIKNYTVFLVVALIPWNFFSTTLTQSTAAIVINGGILKKVYFPREILPISIVTSNLINFLISCIIVFGALIISGVGISWYILLVPIIVLIQYIFSLALAFILSAVTVYIRDLEYFINVLVMLWFYLSPIVYPPNFIPVKYKWLFNLNPMLHIIDAYRNILYYKRMPNWSNLFILAIICLLLLVLGYRIFKKLEKRFAEEFNFIGGIIL
jgi:lipopolysaccharide transport system permease protein